MEISLLNTKITFQKNTVTTDKIGNHKNEWEDHYACYATVSGENGREKNVAGQTVEDFDVAFTVRWCRKTSVIDVSGYRILFNNELYDITSIDHMNYKKECIKFRCRKVRR